MKIILTAPELVIASTVAMMRQTQNIKNGARETYGSDPKVAWQNAVQGAIGELVVAKALGVYWSGNIGDFQAADVCKLQVRTTAWDQGKLIVHPDEADDEWFILVTGLKDTYHIRGAILGRHAKQDRFWGELQPGRPAYNVPQGPDLRPIVDMQRLVD